jgi:acetolactate synthase-1/2/3 large subunit
VADALVAHGIDTAFGVPGESYLALLEGLYAWRERFRFIACRHEGGAAFMADAYAKLTGRPGVCMVTRGPGASNAAIGVHTAQQDSTPLVLLVGQIDGRMAEREAFQEIDYRRMFGPLAKWVAQIDHAERVPEMLSHALHCAMSGRRGPVVLALPEDMLAATAAVADAPPYASIQAGLRPNDAAQLAELLQSCQRPLVILGGSGWTSQAAADLRRFAEAQMLPVACAFRFQDLFDNHHPHYVGDVGIGINPKLAARIRDADLLLVVGARLGEMTSSGYTLFDIPVPRQPMVHVYPGVEELGRVYRARLMINAGMPEFCAALAGLAAPPAADSAAARRAWLQAARADYEAWQGEPPLYAAGGPAAAAPLNLWRVVQRLRASLPADAVVTNGAGNFATWAHRFWRYGGIEHARTQLAPTSGAMGYGLPAAVAAAIAAPQRTVVNFAGDGDFMMNGQELATARQYGAAPLVLVFDNGMYGTIRMHQEREYPGHVYGTALHNPDFAALARAYGCAGFQAASNAEFDAALPLALAAVRERRVPALIALRVDPEHLTPGMSLSAMRDRPR